MRCLACDHRLSRFTLSELLTDANPGFLEHVCATTGSEIAPDADAVVENTDEFRIVDCARCGGMLKPDIVYFGEFVPRDRVERAYALVDDADVLLVAGSSLTVQSGLRFVRRAVSTGTPVAIVNRGPTRGDRLADIRVDAGCSEILAGLAAS